MASRLTREKDFPTALHAFKKLLETNKDDGLVIVGSGPEKSYIQLTINNLQLVFVEYFTK